jgi:hypothetical protein
MAKFDELNKNINNVLFKLIESQNLCKLLLYPTNDALSQPDISDTSSLLFERIYPLPKIPDPVSETGSFLTVLFDSFQLGNNVGTKQGLLTFVVIVHIDSWRMEGTGMLRPFAIMNEIDKLFNQERVIGVKKIDINDGRLIKMNDKFWGYELNYRIVNGN